MRIGHGSLHLSVLSIVFAVTALIVGLLAALYWLKASKIEIDPGWRIDPPRSAADAQRPIEPGDVQRSQMCWLTATMTAAVESANVNKGAAKLTAIAVGLSALSSILGALAGLFSPH